MKRKYGVFLDGKAVIKKLLTMDEAYSLCLELKSQGISINRITYKLEGEMSTHRYKQLEKLKRYLRNNLDEVSLEISERYTKLIKIIKRRQQKYCLVQSRDSIGDMLTSCGY